MLDPARGAITRCGAVHLVPRGGTVAQSSHEWHSTRKMAGRECPLVVKCYLWVDLMVPRPNTRDVHICEIERHTARPPAPRGTRPDRPGPCPWPSASPRAALAWPCPLRAGTPGRGPCAPSARPPRRDRGYLIESPSLGASPSKGVPGGAVHRQQPCRSEEFPIRV